MHLPQPTALHATNKPHVVRLLEGQADEVDIDLRQLINVSLVPVAGQLALARHVAEMAANGDTARLIGMSEAMRKEIRRAAARRTDAPIYCGVDRNAYGETRSPGVVIVRLRTEDDRAAFTASRPEGRY